MMTWNQNLKRGHFTADKTLTSLQRLPFQKRKKWRSVEPQLFEEIFLSSKMKLETFKAQNVVNLWMYQSVVTQPKEKNASLQIHLLVHFLASSKDRKGNQMQEKNCVNWLILWQFPFNSIFLLFSLNYNYSAQNAEFYITVQAVSAWFWALPWLGLSWVCTDPSSLGYFNLFYCHQCLNNKFWCHWKDFHEITNILYILKERNLKATLEKYFCEIWE